MFGEYMLEAQLADVLPPSAYDLQKQLSNGSRPDCLLKAPNAFDSLIIDSKFPRENYSALVAAKTDEEKKHAEAQFRKDMKKHISDIGEKYIIPGETADIAVMYLPAESIFMEVHANFPELIELARKKRVSLASPQTLHALLVTIRTVLRDVQMREQAGIIQKYVGLMTEDVRRLDDRVEALAKHFDQADRDIKGIQTSSRKITGHIEKIEDIEGLDEDMVIEGQKTGPKLRSIE